MAIKEGKDYYTVAQVKSILGINNEMLYNYVENGALERIIPPGKKQGVYRRREVDQLSRELQSFMMHRKNKPTKLIKVTTKEEMRECVKISQALFGIERDTTDERMEIVEKNQETYFMLKDGEEGIIGYFAIIPFKKGKMSKVVNQPLPATIDISDIESFESGVEVDLWLHVIGVKPGFSAHEKHIYGARLVSGIVKLILDLGERGIIINEMAARSNMPDGVRLMKKIGFTEIPPPTPERRTFVICVQDSGIPFIQQYKQALTESQKEKKVAPKIKRSQIKT